MKIIKVEKDDQGRITHIAANLSEQEQKYFVLVALSSCIHAGWIKQDLETGEYTPSNDLLEAMKEGQ